MSKSTNQINTLKCISENDDSLFDGVKILSEFTRKDIEKSYNIDSIKDTEAYFSNRYGWTLRRAID